MDFAQSPQQDAIQEAVSRICARFDDDYWLERDRDGVFPFEFYDALGRDGWLGICTAPQYGDRKSVV